MERDIKIAVIGLGYFPLSCGIIVSRSPGEGVPPGVSSWNFKRNSISFLLLSDMIFLS